jgi:hypothetical protein
MCALYVLFFLLMGTVREERESITKDVWVPSGVELQPEARFRIGLANNVRDLTLEEFKSQGFERVTVVRSPDDTTFNYWARNTDKESLVDLFHTSITVYTLPSNGGKIIQHRLDPETQKVYLERYFREDMSLLGYGFIAFLGLATFGFGWYNFTKPAPKKKGAVVAPI